MIKIIASDMDGTLLADDKSLDTEIFSIIKQLKDKKITFVVSSGRQYPSLKRIFAPVKDDIYFIAENGAFITHQEKEIYSCVMNRDLVVSSLDAIDSIKGAEVMLCGKYCAYTTNPETKKMMCSSRFHYNVELVDDLRMVKEDIIKVSIVDKVDVHKNSFQMLYPIFGKDAELTVSGFDCLDIVTKGVSKGKAIHKLQELLDADYHSTVVFGDNYNDVDMFPMAYYSYAMENADKAVKEQARFVAGNNNDGAVIEEIKKLTGVVGGKQ